VDLSSEIIEFGISQQDRILHVGCCDKQINLIDKLEKMGIEAFYLGVDVKDEIIELKSKYENTPNYNFIKKPVQDFIDEELSEYTSGDIFEYTILTGLFDKPIYGEKHYLFISTLIERCMFFSDKVIFSINSDNYSKHSYSIIYVMNILMNAYNHVTIKKIKKNNYIFCITH
jgi:hypothetical protein